MRIGTFKVRNSNFYILFILHMTVNIRGKNTVLTCKILLLYHDFISVRILTKNDNVFIFG